eukprot:TRINITY_DN39594_c0_g1_i1.p1 TRINITY_DN39594_c0_g1~~TRINITY_DN39594_c0_g1_i1.p1  ORF type:complete len:304 (+),score=54.09 TRINITY_DN39594_c0_g1_i1:87-914(+)
MPHMSKLLVTVALAATAHGCLQPEDYAARCLASQGVDLQDAEMKLGIEACGLARALAPCKNDLVDLLRADGPCAAELPDGMSLSMEDADQVLGMCEQLQPQPYSLQRTLKLTKIGRHAMSYVRQGGRGAQCRAAKQHVAMCIQSHQDSVVPAFMALAKDACHRAQQMLPCSGERKLLRADVCGGQEELAEVHGVLEEVVQECASLPPMLDERTAIVQSKSVQAEMPSSRPGLFFFVGFMCLCASVVYGVRRMTVNFDSSQTEGLAMSQEQDYGTV